MLRGAQWKAQIADDGTYSRPRKCPFVSGSEIDSGTFKDISFGLGLTANTKAIRYEELPQFQSSITSI